MKLSIDPSVNNVGVCYYNPNSKEYFWKLFQPPKALSLQQKLKWLEHRLEVWIEQTFDEPTFGCITSVICEYPQFFNNQRGAIAKTKGYTEDLACICGFMAGICKFAKAFFYTPNQWKGNLTKHAIEHRFKKAFPAERLPSEHEMEACMMMKFHNEQ